MRFTFCCLLFFIASSGFGQSVDTLFGPIRADKVIPPDDPRAIQAHNEIEAVLDQMIGRWNARDIEGCMNAAWKSNDFRIVMDGESVVGWARVLEAYQRGYADRKTMGKLICTDVKTWLITPTLAFVTHRWRQLANEKERVGRSMVIVAKFSEGWKIALDLGTYHLHTPLQSDPYHLRRWKVVPFGALDPSPIAIRRPQDLLANAERSSQPPVGLSILPSSAENPRTVQFGSRDEPSLWPNLAAQ